MVRSPRRPVARLVLLLLGSLGLALAPVRADSPDPGGWFPLDVKHRWQYELTLTIDSATQKAADYRTVKETTSLEGHQGVIVEDWIENPESHERRLENTEVYARDGNAILLLSARTGEGPVHLLVPPRLFLDLALLDKVATQPRRAPGQTGGPERASWSWASADGRESFETIVEGRFEDGELPGHRGAGVILKTHGTLKSADGKRTAVQERQLWLVRGTGIVKDASTYVPPGNQHKTEIVSELVSAGAQAPDGGTR